MTCEICKRGSSDDPPTTVYRQNVKGQPGVWRCATHNTTPIDPVVQRVVDAVECDCMDCAIAGEPTH
jgi:hypothetical protein